jgi:hypothetical protein
MMTPSRPIDLSTPLSFRTSFGFPLQSALARREVLIGALLLVFLPGVGWLLNMGHRIQMVHRMQQGLPAWPAWTDWLALLRHGFVTLLGMIYWHLPGALTIAIGVHFDRPVVVILGALFFLCGTVAVPGYMTHYCRAFDVREVFSPLLAIRRIRGAGRAYWRAWSIAASALALSFVGLVGFGAFFFVTSVWFWQVAGFSFASVFTQTYGLEKKIGAAHA